MVWLQEEVCRGSDGVMSPGMEVAEGTSLMTLAFSPVQLTLDFALQSGQGFYIPEAVNAGEPSRKPRKPTRGFGSPRPHRAREGQACPCEGQLFSGPVPRCAPQGPPRILRRGGVGEWVGEPVQLCRLAPRNPPGGSGMFPSNYQAPGSERLPVCWENIGFGVGLGEWGGSPGQRPLPTVTPRRADHVSHASPLLWEAQGH